MARTRQAGPREVTPDERAALRAAIEREAAAVGAQVTASAGALHVACGTIDLSLTHANIYTTIGLERDLERIEAIVRALRAAAPRAS